MLLLGKKQTADSFRRFTPFDLLLLSLPSADFFEPKRRNYTEFVAFVFHFCSHTCTLMEKICLTEDGVSSSSRLLLTAAVAEVEAVGPAKKFEYKSFWGGNQLKAIWAELTKINRVESLNSDRASEVHFSSLNVARGRRRRAPCRRSAILRVFDGR